MRKKPNSSIPVSQKFAGVSDQHYSCLPVFLNAGDVELKRLYLTVLPWHKTGIIVCGYEQTRKIYTISNPSNKNVVVNTDTPVINFFNR